MQHKRLPKLTTQRSNPKRYELISLSIGWLIAFFISFIDYSLNCYVFRFLTAYYIPLSLCCLIDLGIMIVGIANAGFCVLALFDFDIFSKIGHPSSLSRSLQTQPTQHPKEPHTLSRAGDVHLEGSFIDQSPKNVSSTLVDNLLNRRNPGTDITRRSSTPLLHDIYTDEQLDTLSGIRLNSFAHKTFEPKVNQSFNYEYYTSEEQNEEEKRDLSQLDQSQLDLLNKSEHFEKNPQEHPLEAPKRKHASAGTTKGSKRGRHSLSPSEARVKLHQTDTAKPSRSPKFLMNQKPTVTSIAKLFKHDWKVNGDQFTIMVENLRLFISKQIIQPLALQIQSINAVFRSNNPTRNVSIGKTSIADIEKVCGPKLEKQFANIPYILAYLRLHPNYSHLVKRILTWAQSDMIFDFFPDATSCENTAWPSTFPHSSTSLPTDSELIFRLFCHFMDNNSGLYPITFPFPCDLPFTRLHILSENQQPSDVHLNDNGFYIEFSEIKPMSFKFHASRYPQIVTHPTSNALVAILMLLVYGHGNEWYKILSNKVARF